MGERKDENTTTWREDRFDNVIEKGRKLRICQITDPHLGPLMSPERLRSICECIVDWDPDLVLLTGDNITVCFSLRVVNIQTHFTLLD